MIWDRMQYASDGQWGRGLYFAKDAGYSHFFASTAGTPPAPGLEPLAKEIDEREMIQASLLLGRVVEMDRDTPGMKHRLGGLLNGFADTRSLVAPPFLNSTPPLYADGDGSAGKYDTVTGSTQLDLLLPDGRCLKDPKCPRTKVYVV